MISIKDTKTILSKIRKETDLKKFIKEKSEYYCSKYNITYSQFRFLISVIAAERMNEMNFSMRIS